MNDKLTLASVSTRIENLDTFEGRIFAVSLNKSGERRRHPRDATNVFKEINYTTVLAL